MSIQTRINQIIEEKKDKIIHVHDHIWEFAETRFEEFKSAELLCKVLTEEGFTVTKGVAEIETSFVASFGSGTPIIGVLGEYDALDGLSQQAGVAEQKSLVENGKGHGCGHHSLGSSALAAVIGIKEYMQENNLVGTVQYYGCPGEEGGSGKTYMTRAGCFKNVDVALTCHPGIENSVTAYNFLANIQTYFKFHGISSHAAASPHLGKSALDAVELMNVGVNYLREHIIQEARVHYAVTDSGGRSPNVVQPEAEVLYLIRAPKLAQVREIYARIIDIAKGAALMTGTNLEVVFDKGCSNLVPNRTLEKLLHQKFQEFGPVPVDKQDIEFARKIIKTLNEKQSTSSRDMLVMLYGEKGKPLIQMIKDKDVVDVVYPFIDIDEAIPASSDIGDVSWNVPTVQITTVCFANNTPFHSWQEVAQGKSELCHKGMLHAGKIMASAAIDLLENPALLEKIQAEFKERLGGETYECPIPLNVKPASRR